MSKGLGQIQRDLLTQLEGRTTVVDTFTLAADVYRLEPNSDGMRVLNDAQLVSVRRALLKLASAGKAFKIMRGHDKRAYWANERLGLWLTVRQLQQKSMVIAAAGDNDTMMAHAEAMIPLIIRAKNLGVDVDNSAFA